MKVIKINIFLKVSILLLVLTSSIKGFAQSPDIEWQRAYGGVGWEYAKSIIQTADSGYVACGYSESANDHDIKGNHGYRDVWVIKFTQNGTIAWKKCYGGSNNDEGYCIKQTFDGGYIICGMSGSINGDAIGNFGLEDMWVIKTNSAGTIEWQRKYGGSGYETAYSITQTRDSGYILTGYTDSRDFQATGNHGQQDVILIKIKKDGTPVWAKCYGGSDNEYPSTIIETADGYVFAATTGSWSDDVKGKHNSWYFEDVWIVKTDTTGNILWSKCYGGAQDDVAFSMIQTKDGGYLVAGETSSSDGDLVNTRISKDVWTIKLNDTGKIIWQKTIGGSDWEYPTSVNQTNDGGYVVTGFTQSKNGDITGSHGGSDVFVCKLNSSGTLNWMRVYGGTGAEEGDCIQQTIDGGYIVLASSNSTDGDVTGVHDGGNSQSDYWIVKLKSTTDVPAVNYTEKDAIKVYPTLTKGYVKIDMPEGYENAKLRLISLTGRQIDLSCDNCGTSRELHMQNIPTCEYVLQVLNNGVLTNFKIIYSP